MSRHEIAAHNKAHKVVVGWDPPLQTYFAQVIDRTADEAGWDDKFVLWVGCRPREIPEIDQLANIIRRHAGLETEMRGKLYGDRDENR